MKPYLVIARELTAVTEYRLSRLTRHTAFLIACETYGYMLNLDSPDMMALYDEGILLDIDQFQDRHVADRLRLGLKILSQRYPLTVKRAQRRAEKSVTQGHRQSRKQS